MPRAVNLAVRWLVLSCALLASGSVSGAPTPQATVREISLTRVIRIPVTVLGAQGAAPAAQGSTATLMVSTGGQDELPEGPSGFDVLDDGTFVIADPLRSRIVLFDSQGAFRQEWNIGFAADSITAIPNGLVLVREASTGQLHVFSREGQPRPGERAELPAPAEARLLSATTGTVTRPAAGGARGGPLAIQFDTAGMRLLSLQSIGTDGEGNSYVALEVTKGGEAIEVSKYVRKYTADGKLASEIADLPLDYYVPPVDELRVHNGIVYQLMTTNSEVRINMWDTK